MMANYVENSALERVLRVTLTAEDAEAGTGMQPPVVYLSDLAQELVTEGSAPELNDLTLERALMARLAAPPPTYPQWPVHYLVGCYVRASAELRGKDQALVKLLELAKELTVSYTALILTLQMFPQPAAAQSMGALQLMDGLQAGVGRGSSSTGAFTPGPAMPSTPEPRGGASPLPPAFLDDLAAHLVSQEQEESWTEILTLMANELIDRLSTVSLLADFQGPLVLLQAFLTSRAVVTGLLSLPLWGVAGGSSMNGRELEAKTLLGAAFGISGIPDIVVPGKQRMPNVVDELFPLGSDARPADIRSGVQTLQAASDQLHTALHSLVLNLLRGQDTKEGTLQWLTVAVQVNAERAKMHSDLKVASTDGFMINLTGTLVRLCLPFMGASSAKAWPKLNARYLSDPEARLPLSFDETRVAATGEEVRAWATEWADVSHSRDKAGAAGPSPSPTAPKYHFMCDAFFLMARCQGLGYAKCIENLRSLGRRVSDYENALTELEAHLAEFPGHPLVRSRITQYQRIIQLIKGSDAAYQALLLDPGLLGNILSFCRLMTTYMMRLASPAFAAGGALALPLVEGPPMEFRQLPEAWVESLADILILVAQTQRSASLAQGDMEDLMVFITFCLASPAYVRNPYLRGRLVEVLHALMPPNEDPGSGFNAPPRTQASHAEIAALFQAHPLVLDNMVKSLVQLYVDIEMTDRHNTFYEKFTTRYQIGEIMAYLWQLPQHQASWRGVAKEHPYIYVRFINMMINDSQFLLQEALETLPKVQEVERAMEDEAAWAALPDAERTEREEQLRTDRGRLKSDFYLASVCIQTMQYTAADEAVGSLYFDLQVRDRQARILNFFLKYLTLPSERRKLKLREPERYNWHPGRLVAQLASLHVSLFRRDAAAWVEACVADTDYLGNAPDIFEYLDQVLVRLGTLPAADLADLRSLAKRVDQARLEAEAEEQALDDIPPEFEDPVLGTLMRDPVKLPSGNVLDRATIMQHLLTDQRDPFSRVPMSEKDMEPMPELQAQIAAWLAEQRRARAAAAAAAEEKTDMEEG
uniref:RING-type E3 ubiquitin transferase n=2 Tax=Auxenochlorella protothecoides TaxID=3075 RepID=A0A1D2ADH7_AUXPR